MTTLSPHNQRTMELAYAFRACGLDEYVKIHAALLAHLQRDNHTQGVDEMNDQNEPTPLPEPDGYRIKIHNSVNAFVVRPDVAEERELKLSDTYGSENVSVDAVCTVAKLQAYGAAEFDRALELAAQLCDKKLASADAGKLIRSLKGNV